MLNSPVFKTLRNVRSNTSLIKLIKRLANLTQSQLVNKSLQSDCMPGKLKEATLKTKLKKDSLNSKEYTSFRRISNLKLLSKVIEKVVAAQFLEHLPVNNLEEPLQSVYKLHHSPTALLKVQNDIFIAIDNHKCVACYHWMCQLHLTLSIMNFYCNECLNDLE